MAKTWTLDFYADAAHGWLKVPKSYLDLNIEHWRKMFSPFSYESKTDVFLEEDVDAPTFEKWHREHRSHCQLKFRTHQTNKRSRIRNYDPMYPMDSLTPKLWSNRQNG